MVKRNEAVPKMQHLSVSDQKRQLGTLFKEYEPANAQRSKFKQWLKQFDPQSQEVIESAFLFGQQIQVSQVIPALHEFTSAQMQVAAATAWIEGAVMSTNGPETRRSIQAGVNNLISALSNLDMTIQQINNDPDGTVYINPEAIHGIVERFYDLQQHAREFVSDTTEGTDRRFEALREYIQAHPLLAGSVMNIPVTSAKRGRPPEEVLERIDSAIYKFGKEGLPYARAVNRALAHFTEGADQEAINYIAGIRDRQKFGKAAIARHQSRMQIANS